MESFCSFVVMKKILFIFVSILLLGCEKFVTDVKSVTLSGKYVVSKLEITNVDQNTSRDSLYLLGTVYTNRNLPNPFDTIRINNSYLHFDYSTVRMKLLGVTPMGRDIWQYGSSPNFIFYDLFGTTAYHNGYIQYDYQTRDGSYRRVTFLIEDDGLESLQLKSSGAWFNGKNGEKQVMTLFLTRVGP